MSRINIYRKRWCVMEELMIYVVMIIANLFAIIDWYLNKTIKINRIGVKSWWMYDYVVKGKWITFDQTTCIKF